LEGQISDNPGMTIGSNNAKDFYDNDTNVILARSILQCPTARRYCSETPLRRRHTARTRSSKRTLF
jgi:hypothetical protein